jgi:hypothetical protein
MSTLVKSVQNKRSRPQQSEAQTNAATAAIRREPVVLTTVLNDDTIRKILTDESIDCADVARFAMTSVKNYVFIKENLPYFYAVLRKKNPNVLPPLRADHITMSDYSRACAVAKLARHDGFQRLFGDTVPEMHQMLDAVYDNTGMFTPAYTPSNHARQVYNREREQVRIRAQEKRTALGLANHYTLPEYDLVRSLALEDAINTIYTHGGPDSSDAMTTALQVPNRTLPYLLDTFDDEIDLRSIDESLIANADAYSAAYATADDQTMITTDLAIASSRSLVDAEFNQFLLDGGDMEAWAPMRVIRSKEQLHRAFKLFHILKRAVPTASNDYVASIAKRLAAVNVSDAIASLFAIQQAQQAQPTNTPSGILTMLDEYISDDKSRIKTSVQLLADVLTANISIMRVLRVLSFFTSLNTNYNDSESELFSIVASEMLELGQDPQHDQLTDKELWKRARDLRDNIRLQEETDNEDASPEHSQ